jgi:hypothetical protein
VLPDKSRALHPRLSTNMCALAVAVRVSMV